MDELRILGIAPFFNLNNQMIETASIYPDIYFKGVIGDLDEGVSIALEYQDDFDLIISRGGTAKYLSESCKIPVIEIDISMLDLLRVIKVTDLYQSKHAFIGFSNITKQMTVLSEILEKNMEIITIQHSNDLPFIIEKLKKNGYTLIIGDQVTSKVAREYHMNTLLIESGIESIIETFDKAIVIGKKIKQNISNVELENLVKKKLSVSSFIFNIDGQLLYENTSFNIEEIKTNIEKFIKELKKTPNIEVSQHIVKKNNLFKLYGKVEIELDQIYLMIVKKHRKTFESSLISYIESNENDHYESENSSIFVGENDSLLQDGLESNQPIVLHGEKGTGKLKASKILVQKISNQNNWLIDFSEECSNYEWIALFESETSVFYDVNTTFVIKGLENLSVERQKELLSFISNYYLSTNRWIIIVDKYDSNYKELMLYLDAFLNAYFIFLKPLRDRKEDVSSLISLYLFNYNKILGKNILGFEPLAMDMILTYDWPGNLDQLKKYVKQLMEITKGSFISAQDTQLRIKHNERDYFDSSFISDEVLLNTDLKDLEKLIILRVLNLNNNNKTKTAKQLGISRSTLWRLLK